MPASTAKINQEQRKKNKFQINENIHFKLIQNDNILVIFLSLQSKLQLFRDNGALLCKQLKKILVVIQLEKSSLASAIL